VAASYGTFHIVSSLNAAIFLGWIVLAIGAWRSGVLGLARSVALGAMAALMMGVLKGTSTASVAATASLSIALVPLGVKVLCEPPRPASRQFLVWTALLLALAAALAFTGRLG
jgi:hypothetical protein